VTVLLATVGGCAAPAEAPSIKGEGEIRRVVNVEADGFIGTESLEALNSFDVNIFDMVYDEREDEHYKTIIERKPYLQENYNGWRARAYKV